MQRLQYKSELLEKESRDSYGQLKAITEDSDSASETDTILPNVQEMDDKTVYVKVGKAQYSIMLEKLDQLGLHKHTDQSSATVTSDNTQVEFLTVDPATHANADRIALKNPNFIGMEGSYSSSMESTGWQTMTDYSPSQSPDDFSQSPQSASPMQCHSVQSSVSDMTTGNSGSSLYFNQSPGSNGLSRRTKGKRKSLQERNPGLVQLLKQKPNESAKKCRTVSSVMLTGCGGINHSQVLKERGFKPGKYTSVMCVQLYNIQTLFQMHLY